MLGAPGIAVLMLTSSGGEDERPQIPAVAPVQAVLEGMAVLSRQGWPLCLCPCLTTQGGFSGGEALECLLD